LNARLDATNAREILVEFLAIVASELPLQRTRIIHHEIEQRLLRRLALTEIFRPLTLPTGAKQPLEYQTRIRFRRHGHRRGRPRKIVLVSAGITRVTAA